MRKVFVLVLALLVALMGMGAAAEATTVTSMNLGNEQNRDIPFSNGFTGVCIDQSWKGTDPDAAFIVVDADDVNYNRGDGTLKVDQQLKAAMIGGHNKIFNRYNQGGYNYNILDSGMGVMTNKVFWYYTDDYSKKGIDSEKMFSAADVVKAGETFLGSINDTIGNEYWHQIDTDTNARFEFRVMNPVVAQNEDGDHYQSFFAYKITYFREKEVKVGDDWTFSAEISDTARGGENALAYQWTVEKSNGTKTTYDPSALGKVVIEDAQLEDHNTKYHCTVTDVNGCQNYYTFTLKVQGGSDNTDDIVEPEITSPLEDAVVSYEANKPVTLQATANNADSYQWYEKAVGSSGFTAIKDATGSTYTIPADQSESKNGYQYYCSAIKDHMYDNSAVLTLGIKPVIVNPTQETEKEVTDGSVTLGVSAKYAQEYQWYVKESGTSEYVAFGDRTTNVSLTLNNVKLTDDGDCYYCEAINANGKAKSADFVLNVTQSEEGQTPSFVNPEDEVEWPFKAGEDVTLTMPSEAGDGMRFAWFVIGGDGEPERLDAETGDTFGINDCASEYDGMVFVCVASDAAGNTSSLAFRLVMVSEGASSGELPVIISPTESTEVPFFAGESVTLSIVAENATEYQWFVDKGDGNLVEIKGANESSYTIGSLSAEQDGWVYLCGVSNEYGGVLSQAFILSAVSVPAMPQTGDDSAIFMWAGLMACAMAGCLMILRRKDAVR